MDLSFNRKSIFRKSFRQRRPSSTIPPAAVCLMKSLRKSSHQSTTSRRSMKMSKLLKRNEQEVKLNSGSCVSPAPSCKFLSINDEDKLLPEISPMLRRQDTFAKLPETTTTKWSVSSSPLKRQVSKVVSTMDRIFCDTPRKKVAKLFRRSSSESLCHSSSSINMELSGSYKVLVFE